ncbi:MAG: YdcH family protein [Acidobacteriia bacterium]|nr:YdcH family protein [Terriglobia bacterium]
MSTPTEAIREQLMASSPEYQRLREEHARLAIQLQQLASKPYLTEQEQIEEVRLKKLKLRAKDQMESLVRQFQAA